MNANEELLRTEKLSVCFQGGNYVQAVEDVSLSVYKGNKLCIIGETGSGKSIFLLAILRLLGKSAKVTGDALYRGRSLFSASPKELDRIRGGMISYVPQGSGNGMNPLLCNGFQVGEPLMAHCGFSKPEANTRAIELLRKFHLGREEAIAKQYPFTLSGGMRQRVLIAMGVSAEAEIMFADEPTKGLDEKRINLVLDAFRELKKQTLVCVTHDLSFARSIASRVSVMYAANQVEMADADELFSKPLHPYTRDMIAAMPENGLQFNTGFAPAHGDEKVVGCKYRNRCMEHDSRCLKVPPMVNVQNRQVRCWKYV
ncbi:MAG: ABC transporter ATP-binding protein [Christensenellales bacterium]